MWRVTEDGESERRFVMNRIGAERSDMVPRESGPTSVWSFITRASDKLTQEARQMTAMSIAGAAFGEAIDWHAIDWRQVHQTVRRLQARIVKAIQERSTRMTRAGSFISNSASHGR